MGHSDSYPFVWSDPARTKLRFVHELVAEARAPAQTKSRGAGASEEARAQASAP